MRREGGDVVDCVHEKSGKVDGWVTGKGVVDGSRERERELLVDLM